ncbi:hypothetical protein M422DRAFT_23909 [Sphaerobolus stellatus SS14]|nr:hypothetical protein M422DRAFT_23909 [Sphaerobolus stellatus SS14]
MAQTCPIHLGPIPAETHPVVLSSCGHFFCDACVQQLLSTRAKVPCPLCNKPFVKNKVIRVYLNNPDSPSSSQSGSQGIRSFNQFRLNRLGQDASGDDLNDATVEMDELARRARQSEDLELKLLGGQIEDTAKRFRDFIVPQLKEGEALKVKLEEAQNEIAALKQAKERQSTDLTNQATRLRDLEKKRVNLAGRIEIKTGECAQLLAKYEIAEKRRMEAENKTKETKDTLEAQLAKEIEKTNRFKIWAQRNKADARDKQRRIEELEAELEGLRRAANQQRPTSSSTFGSSSPIRSPMATSQSLVFTNDYSFHNDDVMEIPRPPQKRQRTSGPSMEMDRSSRSLMGPPKSSKVAPVPTRTVPPSFSHNPLALVNGKSKSTLSCGPRNRLRA